MLQEYLNSVDKFVVVGDRVLIKQRDMETQRQSGLVLPSTVKEKEEIQSGYIVKCGPGYPIPTVTDEDEPWKENSDEPKYVPLQAQEGDLAVYLKSRAHEIEFENEKFVIVPHNSILLLIREEFEV